MRAITEKTLVPISLVIVLLGGAAWLTTIYVQSSANAAMINTLADRMDSRDDALNKIWRELSEIKGELRRIRR